MYIFYREDSKGSAFRLYEELIELSTLVDYLGKPSFDMPIVPEDVDSSLGFIFSRSSGVELQHSWYFDGAKLVFNSSPSTDTLMLVWGAEEVLNGYSQPKQYEWVYSKNNNDSSTNTHVFKLPDTPESLSYVNPGPGSDNWNGEGTTEDIEGVSPEVKPETGTDSSWNREDEDVTGEMGN
jgi:hypothetical protein